ncbi:MAG: DUF4349 domain-containing protein [Lachnospiraceae bacterium]|nr:DUF4349 domain-containing protein [Lachnospiraceae bacterium]
MKRKWIKGLTVFTVIAGLLTGCGSTGGTKSMMRADSVAENTVAPQEYYDAGIAYDDYAMDSAAAEEIAVEMPAKGGAAAANQTQDPDGLTLLEEKLVYHCNLDIETLDYPATMTSVKDTIAKYGGVIQSESENDSGAGWYYENYRKTSATMHNYLEVRIPSENYDSFLSELDGVGKIINKSTSVDNISQRYYDTTSQIEALKIQEKNLLAMMEKCETIEDMIAVEQRLSEVQYQLSELQTSRRYMDMDVAYSYVNINITEVMEYRQDSEPVRRNTFADRLKNTIWSTGKGFLAFLEGLLFLLIHLTPYILIIVVLCVVFLRKKIRQFIEARKAKKAQKQNQNGTTST